MVNHRHVALTVLGFSFLFMLGLMLAPALGASIGSPPVTGEHRTLARALAAPQVDLEEIVLQQAAQAVGCSSSVTVSGNTYRIHCTVFPGHENDARSSPFRPWYLPMIVQFHSLTPTPTVTWTPSPTATPNSLTPLPDLLVDWMKIELETGGSCAYSAPDLGIRVQFSNIGAAPAGPFVLDVNGNQRSFSGLPGGESLTTWLAGSFIWPGMNTSIVDATNLVQESNEDNNTLSEIVPIPTLPPTCTATGTPTPTRTYTPTPTPSPWPTGDLWWSRQVHVYDAALGTQASILGANVHAAAISSNSCTTDQNGNCTVRVHAHDTGTVHISVTADGFVPFSGNYPGMPPSGALSIGLSASSQ